MVNVLRQEKQRLHAELEEQMELVCVIRYCSCVTLDLQDKQSFAFQVAGAHGGLNQSEMLLLDQQRHHDALQQLHQQVTNVDQLGEHPVLTGWI